MELFFLKAFAGGELKLQSMMYCTATVLQVAAMLNERRVLTATQVKKKTSAVFNDTEPVPEGGFISILIKFIDTSWFK